MQTHQRRRFQEEPVIASIDNLSSNGSGEEPLADSAYDLLLKGIGIASINNRTVYIDGALPDEEIRFVYTALHRKRDYDEGLALEILKTSPYRVEPHCVHFSLCGGCSLQHLSSEAQIQFKQQRLLKHLDEIAEITPQTISAPITGPAWGYRRKARLGAKFVIRKDKVLVGFREKNKPYIADLSTCPVLDNSVGERVGELARMIGKLEACHHIPQIEVAVGDKGTALVFRHLVDLTEHDIAILCRYGEQNNLFIYLQPAGLDSVTLLWPRQASLSYQLSEHNIELFFSPTDFVQVNPAINKKLVNHAITLLEINEDDIILDLFCGIGNFTLPIATKAKTVIGIEAGSIMIDRACDNAKRNALSNASFYAQDLMAITEQAEWMEKKFNKLLLDPPRSGAEHVLGQLDYEDIERIVYVSCNSKTLANDVRLLVQEKGYTLVSACVVDMFPHTAHVESIVLLKKL